MRADAGLLRDWVIFRLLCALLSATPGVGRRKFLLRNAPWPSFNAASIEADSKIRVQTGSVLNTFTTYFPGSITPEKTS